MPAPLDESARQSKTDQSTSGLADDAQFRAFVENTPDGFIERDAQGMITFVNQAACQIVEYSRDELIGVPAGDFIFGPDPRNEHRGQLLQEGLLTGQTLQVRTKRGTLKTISYSTLVIRDSQGNFAGTQIVARDISAHLQTLGVLQHRNEELGALNAIAEILSHPLEMNKALNQVCEELVKITRMESVGITLNDEAQAFTPLIAYRGLSDEFKTQLEHLGLDDPMTRHIAIEGGTVALNDVSQFEGIGLAGARQEGYHAAILVPILQHNQAIGILAVGTKLSTEYEKSDVDLLLNVGRQIGTALENAELYTQMENRMLALDGLARLSAACTSTLELEDICKLVVRWTHQLMHTDLCTLRLLQGDRLVLTTVYPSDRETPLAKSLAIDSFLRETLDNLEPFVANDLRIDTHLPQESRNQTLQGGLESIVIMPIASRNQTLGTLNVLHRQPRVWKLSEVELLKTIANQVANAIDNANLYQQLCKRVEELGGLAQLSAACTSTLELEDISRFVVEWTRQSLQADACVLRTVEGDTLVLAASAPKQHDRASFDAVVPIAPHVRVLTNTLAPFIANDMTSATEIAESDRHRVLEIGWRATVVMPLISRNRVIGVLTVLQSHPHVWQTSEIDLLKTIASQVSNAIDNAQLFQRVRNEQRKIQAIFDSGLSGLYATDAEGRIVMFNHAAERITGWTLEEIHGKPYKEVLADITRMEPCEPLINEALVRKQTAFVQDGRHLKTRDGRIIPTAKAVAPLCDEQGNIIGAVGAFWDLTREKQAELSQQEFLTQVAHQLRSPLSAMLSALEMMEKPRLPKARRKAMWDIIKQDAERLRVFANDLLDHQAIVRSDRPLHIEPLLIAVLAHEMVNRLQVSASKHTFQINSMSPEPIVLADANSVHDILRNLLDNAVNYSPEGTTITLSIQALNYSMIDISVQDQGPGIPLQDIERVFRPFFRSAHTSTQRSHYSHGLGLSIARQAVERMGGKIWINPDTTHGTTIHFTLRRSP